MLAPLGRAARAPRRVASAWCRSPSWPAAVEPRTRLVACSHVSWQTGAVVDAARAGRHARAGAAGRRAGAGRACRVDVDALGCDFYAASGQKWLCGPNGIGYLYVRAELRRRAAPALARLRRPRRLHAGARARPPRRRAAASTSGFPRAAPRGLGAGGAGRARGRRAGRRSTRAPPSWPTRLAEPARPSAVERRAGPRRWSPGRSTTPRPRWRGCAGDGLRGARPARARARCARRSAPGRARRRSPAGRAHLFVSTTIPNTIDAEHDQRDAERADHARRRRPADAPAAAQVERPDAAEDREAVGRGHPDPGQQPTPRPRSAARPSRSSRQHQASAGAGARRPARARRENSERRPADDQRRARRAARRRPSRTGA